MLFRKAILLFLQKLLTILSSKMYISYNITLTSQKTITTSYNENKYVHMY